MANAEVVLTVKTANEKIQQLQELTDKLVDEWERGSQPDPI